MKNLKLPRIRFKGKNAWLLSIKDKCTTGIAYYQIRIMFVPNDDHQTYSLVKATYYMKTDASRRVERLEKVETIASKCTFQ